MIVSNRISEAEAVKLYGAEMVQHFKDQLPEAPAPRPRTRLSLQDFERHGIDVVKELWDTLQLITTPKDKLDGLLKMLRFVLPTMASIDIQGDIKTESIGPTFDISKVPAQDLVALLRKEANLDYASPSE